jgi:hypothetical protein
MDLKNLKPVSDTVEVILVHPETFESFTNEDGSEMSITLYAQHSKEHKSAMHEIQNRRIQKMQKGKKSATFLSEDFENEQVEVLAKSTKDWDITYDGKKVKFSVEKAMEIYAELFVVRNQLEEALSTSTVFTTI